jgi:hypothetical protein
VRVDRDPVVAQEADDAAEQRLVDIDATEALDLLGPAELLEAVLGLAQDRRVERPATEVVDPDDRPDRYPLLLVVMDGGRLGFGQQRHVVDVRQADGLLDQVDLVGAVGRRMGQHDGVRRAAGSFADRGDDRPEQVGEQRLGAVRGPTEDDRRRVAETALELAGGPGRLVLGASLGRVADEHVAVREHDDGWDGGRALAKLEDLDPSVAGRGGGGIGRAEIDPQRERHRSSTSVRR